MATLREIRNAIVHDVETKLGRELIPEHNYLPERPDYPIIIYSIPTPLASNNGSWGLCEDNVLRKQFSQTWSFTLVSDNDQTLTDDAIALHRIFDKKNEELCGQGIIPVSTTNITSKDTFLNIDYDYRLGFDVKFAFYLEALNDVETVDVAYDFTEED